MLMARGAAPKGVGLTMHPQDNPSAAPSASPPLGMTEETPYFYAGPILSALGLRSCAERGCVLRGWNDDHNLRYVVQHGDNPEAVMFITYVEAAAVGYNIIPRIPDWVARCHEYEDGL